MNRQHVNRLLCISILLLIGFVALTLLVLTGATQSADVAALHTVHDLSSPTLNTWALIITMLGSPVIVGLAVACLAGWCAYRRHWLKFGMLVFGIMGAGLLNYIIKHIIARARPELWDRLVTETGSSFPSGHAM